MSLGKTQNQTFDNFDLMGQQYVFEMLKNSYPAQSINDVLPFTTARNDDFDGNTLSASVRNGLFGSFTFSNSVAQSTVRLHTYNDRGEDVTLDVQNGSLSGAVPVTIFGYFHFIEVLDKELGCNWNFCGWKTDENKKSGGGVIGFKSDFAYQAVPSGGIVPFNESNLLSTTDDVFSRSVSTIYLKKGISTLNCVYYLPIVASGHDIVDFASAWTSVISPSVGFSYSVSSNDGFYIVAASFTGVNADFTQSWHRL